MSIDRYTYYDKISTSFLYNLHGIKMILFIYIGNINKRFIAKKPDSCLFFRCLCNYFQKMM